MRQEAGIMAEISVLVKDGQIVKNLVGDMTMSF